MPFKNLPLLLCLFLLTSGLAFSNAPIIAEATTALSMTSDAGDYIGAGRNYNYGSTGNTYSLSAGDQNHDGVVDYVGVSFNGQNGDWWYLDFSSRLTGRNLAPGFYADAVRYPFEDGNHAGLSVDGNGRGCNTLVGNFTVHDAEFNYSATPIQVVRFTATFEQHCEGGTTAFYGTIYYNYTPAGPNYSISGQVVDNTGTPVAGTPIGLFGSQTASTTTDANGNYRFEQLLSQGTFRIVPTDPTFSPSPTNRLFTRLSADQTADFSLVPYYIITGQVINDLGSPLTGVTVTLTGSRNQTVSTDSNGRYAFNSLLANGSYTVTPSRVFYVFTPTSRSYNTLPGNQSADFVGNITRYSISGRLLDNFGAGLAGVRVDLFGGPTTLSVMTDNNGIYAFEGVRAGTDYQVHPASSTYVFTPQTQYFYSLDRNYSNILFTGNFASRYAISGFTLDTSGNPVAGTTVTLAGSASMVTSSDASGYFVFNSLPAAANYVVTPSKSGFNFAPTSRTTTSLNANLSFNFVGATRLVNGATQFDFDGDGKTDIGISRPNGGIKEWWLSRSSDSNGFSTVFGVDSDIPAPADFTGDGKADIAVFRPSNGNWFVLRSDDFTYLAFPFGSNGDIPMPADYDGDGKADPAVFRSSDSTWYIARSSDNQTTIAQFGAPGDQPVAADYDGDGKADIAIYRQNNGAQEWWIQRSTAGLFATVFGASGDKAVPGDYTGDGKTDVAVWRPSNGNWFILRSEDFSYLAFPWGTNGDLPAPGDYDGDGKTDAAVFRPSSATWFVNRTGGAGPLITDFGAATDSPVAGAFVR